MTNQQHLTPALLSKAVPLGRAGTLSDMAGPVLFLAGRAGAYVNGAVWLIDGGRVGQVASCYS
jgi:NAD(P)-dependent dehydrogenase (short-subunit alcohol dehydrogenase family)